WARDPEGARGRAETGQSGTPSRLDRAGLERVRQRLPDGQGDTEGLTRAVDLPADRLTPLLNQAEKSAHQLGHSFEHHTTDTGVAFTVRTASVGAVTTRDIEMAERIAATRASIGAGGRGLAPPSADHPGHRPTRARRTPAQREPARALARG